MTNNELEKKVEYMEAVIGMTAERLKQYMANKLDDEECVHLILEIFHNAGVYSYAERFSDKEPEKSTFADLQFTEIPPADAMNYTIPVNGRIY